MLCMTLIVLLRLTRTGTSRYSGKRISLTRLHDRQFLLQPYPPAAILLAQTLHQPLIKGLYGGKLPTSPRLQPLVQTDLPVANTINALKVKRKL